MILEKINKPNDIKKLDPIEYNQLAYEIRQFLIENISKTGGHLASNLGVQILHRREIQQSRFFGQCFSWYRLLDLQ